MGDKRKFIAFFLILVMVFAETVVFVDTDSSDAGMADRVDVSYDNGVVIDTASGNRYDGGEFINELTLLYIPNNGYEFVSWNVSGDAEYSADLNRITIESVTGSILITVNSRNYSTSQQLISVIDEDDLAEPGDELVLSWSFKSELFEKTNGVWTAAPSTPLIVGDSAYIRAGSRLYQVDVETGTVENYVLSRGDVSFYHYVDYGGGVIFDCIGHKAYDLNLNYLYDLPSNLVFAAYHDGFFYGCLSYGGSQYSMYKTSTGVDTDLSNNVKQNLFDSAEKFNIFAQYGQFTNVQFVDNWFFFLQADGGVGKSGYRAISAFNVDTEKLVTCRLTGFEGMPWDDGWLTYYDGYFYLTAYTAGLFDGVIKGLEDKRSSLMWVKFDFENGKFEEPSFKNIQTPEGQEFKGIASGLVIYGGRGYVDVRALGDDTLGHSDDTGSKMIAYDIGKNGEPIPSGSAPSSMTHGGIVVNAAHADEGRVYIYMIPYNAADQALMVFTDEKIDGKWTLKSSYDRLELTRTDWSSQGIRAGPNGEIIFYVDTGYVDCYVPVSKYWINVLTVERNGAKSDVGYGTTVKSVLESMYPSAIINGSELTLGDKVYTIFGLNEVTGKWETVRNPDTGAYSGIYNFGVTESHYRHIIVTEDKSLISLPEDDSKGWYYFNTEYRKASFGDAETLKDARGCSLFYLDSKPSDNAVMLDPILRINRESSTSIELPELLESTYSVADPSVISVTRDGNVLNITAVKEKSTELTVTIDGKDYITSVLVLPKVEIIDGKTVTTSDTESPTEDGGTSHKVIKTVVTDSRNDRETTVTVSDKDGKVIADTVTTEASYKEPSADGKTADIIERTVKGTESGTVTSDTVYRSETVTESIDLGETKVTVTEATLDNLDNTIVRTTTVRYEYGSYNISDVKTENFSVSGGKEDPTGSSTDVIYDSKISDLTITKNGTALSIDDKAYSDLSKLLDAASKDAGVDSITANVGSSIDADSLRSAAAANAVVIMNAGSSEISLGSDAINALPLDKGRVDFEVTSDVTMTPKQQNAAGDAKVFSIVLSCGNEEQHDFGTFTATLDCEVAPEDGKVLKVWRIDDYGNKTYATDVSYADGKVTFTADHLSLYAVGNEAKAAEPAGEDDSGSSGSGDLMVYAAIGVIAVLALLGAVFVLKRRG